MEPEVTRSVAVDFFTLIVVWVVSVSLHRFPFPAMGFSFHAGLVAHLIGVMAPTISTSVGHRYFAFQRG